jgi:hypothetical protein
MLNIYCTKVKTVLKFENILFILYLGIFIRQYLWFLGGMTPWIASYIFSIVLYYTFFSSIKYEYKKNNIGLSFITIICVPLIFLYLLRFVFPDNSWDIINYHFINGERSLEGYPYINGDFLYLSYSNPVSDMLTSLFRKFLGHRLGTIINLISLLN